MDFGFRKKFGDHPYFDGWERLGVGIRPVADQVEALKERGLETLEIERLGEIESWEGLRDHESLKRIQGPPLKGALIPPDILASLKCLVFISSSFTER